MTEDLIKSLNELESCPREIRVSNNLFDMIRAEIPPTVDGPMTVFGLKLVVDPLLKGEEFEVIEYEDWRSEMIHFGL